MTPIGERVIQDFVTNRAMTIVNQNFKRKMTVLTVALVVVGVALLKM